MIDVRSGLPYTGLISNFKLQTILVHQIKYLVSRILNQVSTRFSTRFVPLYNSYSSNRQSILLV